MELNNWLSDNYIEIFGAVTGILYVFLEIRQNIWLWPVGIVTSAVYILVFFTSKFYADMSLQGYYLVISVLGWYWWVRGGGQRAEGRGPSFAEASEDKGEREIDERSEEIPQNGSEKLVVSRLRLRTGIILMVVFSVLFAVIWLVLDRLTDSPVPGWDSFITSLSIIATWMLARKIYEHWYLWIIVNTASVILFIARGLYPTVILYVIYCVMSFAGLKAWKRSL